MAEASIYRVIRKQREAIDRGEKEMLREMARLWIRPYRYLEKQIRDLMTVIRSLQDRGEPVSPGYIYSLERYRDMRDQSLRAIRDYNKAVHKIISGREADAVEIGDSNARELVNIAVPDSPMWTRVNKRETRIMSAMLSAPSPLSDLLNKSYAEYREKIDSVLTTGLATGQGSQWIADRLTEAGEIPLQRALVIARTEVNRTYREANLETMRSSRAVIGYRRMCYPETACFACLMMDGEFYPKYESFSDHPNGKCSAVPVTKHFDPIDQPGWKLGSEWFLEQDEATQRKLMGAGRFDLWKQQGIDPKSMVYLKDNHVWGASPTVKTIEMLKNQNIIKYFSAKSDNNNRHSGLSEDTRNEIINNGLRSLNFTHHLDKMGINALRMKPEKGFQDVIIHGDRFDFAFRDPTLEDHEEGKKYGTEEDVTAEDLAKFVLESKMYTGGPIRLIACEAGHLGGFAAQDLADLLQVPIMAPTEIISIAFDGSYEIRSKNGKEGHWRVIEPKPRSN